jgi:hypothetical protein
MKSSRHPFMTGQFSSNQVRWQNDHNFDDKEAHLVNSKLQYTSEKLTSFQLSTVYYGCCRACSSTHPCKPTYNSLGAYSLKYT